MTRPTFWFVARLTQTPETQQPQRFAPDSGTLDLNKCGRFAGYLSNSCGFFEQMDGEGLA